MTHAGSVSCEKGPGWSRGKGEKEGTAQKTGYGATMTPIPLHCLGTGRGGGKAGNEGVKFSFRRKQSLGEGVFVLSLFLTIFFSEINLIFPEFCLFC